MTELERLHDNRDVGRAPGLWLTLHADLGDRADEVLERILSAIGTWIPIAEQVVATLGHWPGRAAWPPPEEIEPLLPTWLIEQFRTQPEDIPPQNDWILNYMSWLESMEERCWEWWGYARDGRNLSIEMVVDEFPCPVGELCFGDYAICKPIADGWRYQAINLADVTRGCTKSLHGVSVFHESPWCERVP